MDFRYVGSTTATRDVAIEESWPGYPQKLFGNWTPDQVKRSQMLTKCSNNQRSTIYWMDVLDNGKFECSSIENGHISTVATGDLEQFWRILQGEVCLVLSLVSVWVKDGILQRPGNIRVRSLFVDDLTSPVLKMLGTK